MKKNRITTLLLLGLGLCVAGVVAAAEIHHVHLNTSSAPVAVRWYEQYLDCTRVEGRSEAIECGGMQIVFEETTIQGSSQGTGLDHIGFSYTDLDEKMAELEAVGVRGSGVRLQRFEDGSTVRDIPGLFKIAFIFDPWGTRIELVEDKDTLGFHHVHLGTKNPEESLSFYEKTFGGEKASLKGMMPGVRFGEVWVLASRHPDGSPAATGGRSIDHIAFVKDDAGRAAGALEADGVVLISKPVNPPQARTKAKRFFLEAPDNVTLAVVEEGWAGIDSADSAAVDVLTRLADAAPYDPPKTPWGEPDLQGMFTGNAAHGIPLERPEDLDDAEKLTPEEAAARRERGTLGSIWGYEREWRDTTLGYVKSAPSTQVAMVIDPPDGRLPELTENGKKLAEKARNRFNYAREIAAGPEDLTSFVRCIGRGLPGMMMPGIYNNGLQIVQGPGTVAIQKEMIHETRIIKTRDHAPLGPALKQHLGDPRGHWDGNTLVVETTNFNGKLPYRTAGENLKLTERFTLVGPETLEYRFTVEDPDVWTRPWTGMFHFERDEEQYELVEYACHEGNYGMFNILSGARARDKQAAEAESGGK